MSQRSVALKGGGWITFTGDFDLLKLLPPDRRFLDAIIDAAAKDPAQDASPEAEQKPSAAPEAKEP